MCVCVCDVYIYICVYFSGIAAERGWFGRRYAPKFGIGKASDIFPILRIPLELGVPLFFQQTPVTPTQVKRSAFNPPMISAAPVSSPSARRERSSCGTRRADFLAESKGIIIINAWSKKEQQDSKNERCCGKPAPANNYQPYHLSLPSSRVRPPSQPGSLSRCLGSSCHRPSRSPSWWVVHRWASDTACLGDEAGTPESTASDVKCLWREGGVPPT